MSHRGDAEPQQLLRVIERVLEKTTREVELVPDAEAPARFVLVLASLLEGLRLLGIDDATAWLLVTKVALDSMPTAIERLENPAAVLSRSDLRELGLERRAVDAVFRACPVVALPGYSRPLIRVADYLALLERSTFDGRSRVRPS
jgi:hypothetical protein